MKNITLKLSLLTLLISVTTLTLLVYPKFKTVIQDTYYKYNIVPTYIYTHPIEIPNIKIYEILVPGLTKDDITVKVVNNEDNYKIVITYNQEKMTSNGITRQLDTIPIPYNVAKKNITATVNNGILTLTIPEKNVDDIHIPVQ